MAAYTRGSSLSMGSMNALQRVLSNVPYCKFLPRTFQFLCSSSLQLASRSKLHIRDFFMAEPMISITTMLALDDSYLPDADIKLFLEANFDVIKRDPPLRH